MALYLSIGICHLALEKISIWQNSALMANQIRKIRKSKDITLEDLAERTGISTTYLQRMETGARGLSLENLIRIARGLEVEPIEVSNEFDHEQLAGADRVLAEEAKPRGDLIDQIDITAGLGGGGLSIIEATSGATGLSFHREAVSDYWRMPASVMARLGILPHHVKAFPAQGDSMAPTIEDGDVVFADTRHRVPSPPGVYVLADQFGGVIVKRLEVISRPGDETVNVRISSDNPKHRDQELTLDEIQIIGRYVGRFTV
jgi:phage repressor protein C with HTH and peptisase S24 domain